MNALYATSSQGFAFLCVFLAFLAGWCYGSTSAATVASCTARRASTFRWPEPSYFGGVLGANCSTNPDFCHANAVFLRYCDGASFGSNRAEPIVVRTPSGQQPANMWLRGRPNFDAIIATLQSEFGFGGAAGTEVILSGGSAGGLAVFYNVDHLASLLEPNANVTRVVGFPDAGFFMDHKNTEGTFAYRANFIGADPVWNVTGGGGTNAACLAALAPKGEAWKCLMAQYLVPWIKTPLYVMNSAHDLWQLQNVLQEPQPSCVPTAARPCNATAGNLYGAAFRRTVATVLESNPANGVYVDACYVHEQNVNYCSTQGVPNCVGWTPSSSGSRKWGYATAVDGLTPQEAFSAWYFYGSARSVIDTAPLQGNPTCVYAPLKAAKPEI